MCRILVNKNEYKGEFVSFPARTFDYLVIGIDKQYLVARTLEDNETLSEYNNALISVDGTPAILLKKGFTYDAAVKEVEGLLKSF